MIAHLRHGDLLDDDGTAGQRGGDFFSVKPFRGEDASNAAFATALESMMRAVDDAVGRQWLDRDRGDAIALALWLQLDRLDRAGTNVQPDQAFVATKLH